MPLLTPHTNTLDRRATAHLLRRATFGCTRQESDQYVGKTPAQAFDALTENQPAMRTPKDPKTGEPWKVARVPSNLKQSTGDYDFVRAWIDHMCRIEPSLSEKMTYFYHTFFTTQRHKAPNGIFLFNQSRFFRRYALGNMRVLATKMCHDNAMLLFLDGRRNTTFSPNENFAREFLELYSIGKHGAGGELADYYTEQDVREAARILSGFNVDNTLSQIDADTGIPVGKLKATAEGRLYAHDFDSKVFSEKFDKQVITPQGTGYQAVLQEIEAFVDMVYARPETARHICRRLYRFFVYHTIDADIEQNVIGPLAEQLLENDYEVKPVLRTLLTSQHFYDQDGRADDQKIIGALVKSPLEMVVGTLRYFGVPLPGWQSAEELYALYHIVQQRMEDQGMDLYAPSAVAGYPAYYQAPGFQRNWVSSVTFVHRYKFISDLIGEGLKNNNYSGQLKIDSLAFVKDSPQFSDPKDAEKLVQTLVLDLLPRPIGEEQLTYFVQILLDDLSIINWEMEWKKYQEGSDPVGEGLRSQLNKLLVSIMHVPEYQLY